MIAAGPATDSSLYGSCRHGLFAKSPLTGFYAESYSGGRLAIPISRTGFDAIAIHGASEKPVWLEISGDRDELPRRKQRGIYSKNLFQSPQGDGELTQIE